MSLKEQRKKFFMLIKMIFEGMKLDNSVEGKRRFYLRIQASVTTAEICGIITHRAADQILAIADYTRKKED